MCLFVCVGLQLFNKKMALGLWFQGWFAFASNVIHLGRGLCWGGKFREAAYSCCLADGPLAWVDDALVRKDVAAEKTSTGIKHPSHAGFMLILRLPFLRLKLVHTQEDYHYNDHVQGVSSPQLFYSPRHVRALCLPSFVFRFDSSLLKPSRSPHWLVEVSSREIRTFWLVGSLSKAQYPKGIRCVGTLQSFRMIPKNESCRHCLNNLCKGHNHPWCCHCSCQVSSSKTELT